MKWTLSGIPLLPVFLSLAGGILWVHLFPWPSVWQAVLIPAILAIVCFFIKRPGGIFVFASMGLGALSMAVAEPQLIYFGEHGDRNFEFSGRVEQTSGTAFSQRLIVLVDSAGMEAISPVRMCVYYGDVWPVVIRGDRIVFSAIPEYPYFETGVPDEFSMKEFYRLSGVSVVGCVNAGDLVVARSESGWVGRVEYMRDRLSLAISYSGLSPEAASFLDAVLTGNSLVIDQSVRQTFSQAGIAHILALSGSHVAIITFFIMILLFPVDMAGKRHWRMWFTLAVLWGYALFTGLSPSVVRSVVMASFVLIGRIVGRASNPFNSLCAAGIAILVVSPGDLFRPGFQLSFMAVAAILLFAFEFTVKRGRVQLRLLSSLAAVSLAVVIGTMPLAAWHFHVIPLYFLISNLLAAVVLPLFMCGGILLLLLRFAGFSVGWLADALNLLYDCLSETANFVVSLPGHQISEVYFPGWLLIPCYAGIFLLWLAVSTRKTVYWINSLALLVASVVMYFLLQGWEPQREAFTLHDRYANVFLYREGRRAWLITDAKPKFWDQLRQRMEWRLQDYMGRRGIDSLYVADDSLNVGALCLRGRQWAIGQTLYAVVDSGADLRPMYPRPTYAIVSRNFHEDILLVSSIVRPDTIILSRTIFPAQRDRFVDTLKAHSIPFLERPSCHPGL